MKNLHLIQTDKPSRLFDDGMQLYLGELEDRKGHPVTNYNIYITNSEEIKEGDWFLSKTGIVHNTWGWNYGDKKIILTTDQSLNGVQAINDEFLEWFEKNPSCEEVEVGYGWIRLTETDNEGYWVSIPDKQFEMQQEEPKQETLEEAAEIDLTNLCYYDKRNPDCSLDDGDIEDYKKSLFKKNKTCSCDNCFYGRSKLTEQLIWQQERMYSEEELKSAFKVGFNIGYGSPVQELDLKNEHCERWFEQFSKLKNG